MTPYEHRKFIILFKKAFKAALEACSKKAGETFDPYRLAQEWRSPTAMVLQAIRKNGGVYDWPSVRQFCAKATDIRSHLGVYATDNNTMIEHRCSRIALSIATDNYDHIRSDEHEILRTACTLLNRPVPSLPTPDTACVAAPADGEIIGLDTAFTWDAVAKPRRPGGLVRASVPIPLHGLNPEHAPVVVRLPRPDGGAVELRRSTTEWLRPVLAPGSWETASVSQVAQALADGRAWRDSPHLNRIRRGNWDRANVDRLPVRTLPWMDDYALPGDPTNDEDRAALDLARAQVVADCTGLVAIGDEVWTPIGAPRARLLATYGSRSEGFHILPVWMAGRLASVWTQATISGTHDIVPLREKLPSCNVLTIDLPISRWDVVRRIANAISSVPTPMGPIESVGAQALPKFPDEMFPLLSEILLTLGNATECLECVRAMRTTSSRGDLAAFDAAATRLRPLVGKSLLDTVPERMTSHDAKTTRELYEVVVSEYLSEMRQDILEMRRDDDLEAVAEAFSS